MTSNSVNQKGASAGKNLAGRDNNITEYHQTSARMTQLDHWCQKLAEEMKSDTRVHEFIDSLQYFEKQPSPDGVEGLEAKLDAANRSDDKAKALRKKELFTKILDGLSLFGAGQEVLAYLLAGIETKYDTEVKPYLGKLSNSEIDKIMREKVIEPTIAEIGVIPVSINNNHGYGMVYWLAELCFIRWHK